MPGSRPSLRAYLASAALALGGAAATDGIDAPLLGLQGDAVRGRAVVTRQSSTCVLCHAGPFPNPHLQGDIGPDLRGAGARLSAAQLRLRLVDAARANPETVMPSFYTTGGRTRAGAAWRDRPILTAAEVEDAVAYLSTLRTPP